MIHIEKTMKTLGIVSYLILLFTFSKALCAMENITLKQLNSTLNSAPGDFDFEIGHWKVKHRRMKDVLNGSKEWVEFEGITSTKKVLGGLGNIEDHILNFPGGTFRAIAIRSYNVASKKWSIWWLDGRSPDSMDAPVVGTFKNGIGLFFTNDVIKGIPLKIRFTWLTSNPKAPRWEQAFSKDNGVSWETNWTMDFIAIK